MNFKPGDKLICIGDCSKDTRTKSMNPSPKKDDDVVVFKITDSGWLSLCGYPESIEYEPWNFRKPDHAFSNEIIRGLTNTPEQPTTNNQQPTTTK